MSDQNQQGNDRIEDSLDNLSNFKLRQSSMQKHRVELIQVKQRFVSLLQKLQTSQTRQISLSQIKKLIEKNNDSDHLRIYLSILKSLKPNHNSTTKQHEILVISILAKVFLSNLVDPVDKQPSLLKTCFKVVEILLGYFNDISNTVQQACARVLLDLNEFCLEQGKHQKQQKLSILFAPLVSILRNGVDKASQATATVCINELVKFWYSSRTREYLDLVSRDVFSMILKINSEYHEIFMTSILLIEHKGLAFFQNRLPNFISKILPIIDGTREGTNSFNSYMCKVNVCKIIEKIASLLSPEEREKLSDLNILSSLSKAARNKIIQVQTAATRAIKVWKGESVSVEKPQRHSNSIGKPLRSLEQIRDQKKRERSNSKQNTIKIQNELEYMKEDLEKMVKGGWGANNRAKNYVKRGTGVGGGYYGLVDSTPPKNNKSHRQHLEQLRSLVKKGSKENKNTEKFHPFIEDPRVAQTQVPINSNNTVNVFVQKAQQLVQKTAKSNNSPPPIVSNPQKNNYVHEENDFEEDEDEGDQGVNFVANRKVQRKNSNPTNPNPNPTNPNSTHPKNNSPVQNLSRKNSQSSAQRAEENFQMDQDQVRQLLQNEKNLPQSESLELNFKQSKPKEPTPEQKQPPSRVKDEKFIQRASKIKQNLASVGGMISEEQLEQLMMQNNLSEVSDNISQCLNESDFQMNEENNNQDVGQEDDDIMMVNSGYEETVELKGKQPTNFTKKPTAEKFDESLNYTESQVSKYKQSLGRKDNNKSSFSNSNFKASEAVKEQFTLNPHSQRNQKANKFQSIQENPRNQDLEEQIEEDIVESYYQQSRPKEENNMLPLKTKLNPPIANFKSSPKKTPVPSSKPQTFSQQQQSQEQISRNYQQLIQNPPSSLNQPKHLDKKSFIKYQTKNQSNSVDQNGPDFEQEQEEPKQTVTDKWIRILSLVENDDINSAFEEAFDMDDPIYLIRLLIITRTPISSLTAENCTRLWDKFLNIYQHNFISILFVQLFTQADDLNLIKNSLTIQEMHELLVKLYEVSGTSKGKLSFNAALLYNKVDQSLRPNKN